jgi:hypothetical protein
LSEDLRCDDGLCWHGLDFVVTIRIHLTQDRGLSPAFLVGSKQLLVVQGLMHSLVEHSA